MKYEYCYLHNNDQFTRPKKLTPVGIVVHSTGCNQRNVDVYTKQFNTSNYGKSVHGFLGMHNGELAFVQTLPFTVRCAGCGSGKNGSYNATHIQFEVCEDIGSTIWTDETYNAALDVCEKLCREYAIDPEFVVCHSEAHKRGYASNHADVMHWWSRYGKSMDTFREELGDRLMTRYKTVKDMPTYYQKEAQELVDSGALKGGSNGLDLTEDMIRCLIINKRYIDSKSQK